MNYFLDTVLINNIDHLIYSHEGHGGAGMGTFWAAIVFLIASPFVDFNNDDKKNWGDVEEVP